MRTISAITIATCLGCITGIALPDPVWEELTPMPEGRSGMIAFATDKEEPAYYGGSSWNESGKQIHATGYTLRNDRWQPIDSLPKPIAYASVAGEGDIIYISGGTDGIGLNPVLMTFDHFQEIKEIEILPSQTRLYAGAALIDHVFYQVGGSTQLSPLVPSGTIAKLEHGLWTEVGQLPEGPLINPAVTRWNDSIFILGGGIPGSEGLNNSSSVFSFNTTNHKWTRRTSLPEPVRGAVAISLSGKGVLLLGGYRDPQEFSPRALLSHPEKNEFDSLADLPIGLMLPAVVATENWIYVFGGEDLARHRSNRVFRAKLSILLQSRIE